MSDDHEYKHNVVVEVRAKMNDDGNIHIPEQNLKVDTEVHSPKPWSKDNDRYILVSPSKDLTIETTCGVIRKILKGRE